MKRSAKSLVSEAKFLARLEDLGATPTYEVWLGLREPHSVTCINRHVCTPRPSNVMAGHGICRVCAGCDKGTAESKFYENLRKFGAQPAYDTWLGVNKPHRIICREGHEGFPHPASLANGQGPCRECAGKDPKASERQFLENLSKWGAAPQYTEWLGAIRPHQAICKFGHKCSPRPHDMSKGQGPCGVCTGSLEDVFYIVHDPDGGVVKFGISSGEGQGRLRDHRYNGFTSVVMLRTGLPEGVARQTETAIIAALRSAGAESLRGREYYHEVELPGIEHMAGRLLPTA